MSRFTDKLCPVCRIRFTEIDDVVVCPDCGTPHHRSCYAENGSCGVEQYHSAGFTWNGTLPDEPDRPTWQERQAHSDPHQADYPNISSTISQGIDIPEIHGLEDMPNPYFELYRQIRRVTDDEVRGEDGVSGKELCHFAGKSVMHYAQAFDAFRTGIKKNGINQPVKIFMNFCAGLFMPIHQFYRRMDLLGIALLMLAAVTALPDVLLYYDETYAAISFDSETTSMLNSLAALANVVNIAAMLLISIFGDYIYYRFCVSRIKKIRTRYDDGKAEGYYAALTERGSPSKLRIVIGILAYLLVTQLVANLPAEFLLN